LLARADVSDDERRLDFALFDRAVPAIKIGRQQTSDWRDCSDTSDRAERP